MERFQQAMRRIAEETPPDRAADILEATAAISELFAKMRADLAEIRVSNGKLLGDVQTIIHDEVSAIGRMLDLRMLATEKRAERRALLEGEVEDDTRKG